MKSEYYSKIKLSAGELFKSSPVDNFIFEQYSAVCENVIFVSNLPFQARGNAKQEKIFSFKTKKPFKAGNLKKRIFVSASSLNFNIAAIIIDI